MPITKPRKAGPPQPGTPLEEIAADRVFGEKAGSKVRIAILDTWPNAKDQAELRQIIAAKGDALKASLTAAGADPASIDRALERFERAASDELVPLARIHTNYLDDYATPGESQCVPYLCDGSLDDPQLIPDHGLFIADLIKEVAPGVELSAYRVLNDWGVADLRSIAYAMDHAIKEAGDEPLIINLSLGFTPPLPLLELLFKDPERAVRDSQAWVEEGHERLTATARRRPPRQERGRDDPKDHASGTAAFGAEWSRGILSRDTNGKVTLDGVLKALDLIFRGEYLPSNVLVVAAAGNDSCEQHIADPRIPAVVEGVLGVSAAVPVVGRPGNWQSVRYSNADDLAAPDDGITAFGGDIDQGGMSVDAPIALYTSDLPGGNDVGLAQWSGTSFAAPIAAAYAACIWAAEPDADASTVLEAIVYNPDGTPRRAIPLGYT